MKLFTAPFHRYSHFTLQRKVKRASIISNFEPTEKEPLRYIVREISNTNGNLE